jgi:hypothetical protein
MFADRIVGGRKSDPISCPERVIVDIAGEGSRIVWTDLESIADFIARDSRYYSTQHLCRREPYARNTRAWVISFF